MSLPATPACQSSRNRIQVMTKLMFVPSLALLGACSTVPAVPPSNYTAQPSPRTAGSTDSATSPIRHEFDASTGQSRYVVVIQQGSYFLWIQKPSLAFFYEFAGEVPAAAPQYVYLVFRTQDPTDLNDNKLQLKCDGSAAPFEGLPGSKVVSGIFHNAHYLTYELPRETFHVLAQCSTGEVAVGGVAAGLTNPQLQGLRQLEASYPTP